jgi:hypothetical protein
VLVVGDIEHAGVRDLIIRKPDGTSFHLPGWMISPEAGTIRTLACPRLCVNHLRELPVLVDRPVAPSPGEQVPAGGQGHDTIEDRGIRPARDTTANLRDAGIPARHGSLTDRDAPNRSVASTRHTNRRRAGAASCS